ncbi:MAG: hypothetical protein A2603_12920 [Bdellovibrionales bacterium RIFOXYD1_FULL_55_31]|nr:MAG: hypothetical protein A2603_12920 [Bdellovibrionales bacterium RIFOXYD1_FULL_55_31]
MKRAGRAPKVQTVQNAAEFATTPPAESENKCESSRMIFFANIFLDGISDLQPGYYRISSIRALK